MPRIERTILRERRWRRRLPLVLLVLVCPALVASSSSAATRSRPADHATPYGPIRTWGMLPKVESAVEAGFDSHRNDDDDDADAAAETTAFPRRLIVMGGPASGKGTQCQAIAEEYGLVHLSTGDMLRQAVSSSEESGCDDVERAARIAAIKACMERGELIPDDVVVSLVLDRLNSPDCRRQGWILDGFPRTSNQARALRNVGIHPDTFLFLSVPDDVAIERVVGRRHDPLTGKVYHLNWNPPPNEEIRHRLVIRSDDTVESMKRRLKQFRNNAKAVRSCYDTIHDIDGLGTPEEVLREIDRSLNLNPTASRRKRA